MKRRNFQKSSQVKEYTRKRFKNPYFEGEEERHIRTGRVMLGIFAVLLVLTPLVLIFGPFFQLQGASVSGLTTIPESEVEERIQTHLNGKWAGIVPRSHAWFVQLPLLRQSLMDTYDFSSIEVGIVGDQVVVTAEERISELVWRNNADMYFLNLNGSVMRTLYPEEQQQIATRLDLPAPPAEGEVRSTQPLQPTLPIIRDLNDTPVENEAQLLQPARPDHIITFDKAIRRLRFEPVEYLIEAPNTPWLRVRTKQGIDLLFDAAIETEPQAEILASVLPKYQDKFTEISYIDLRFGNHIYVK